MKPVALSNIFHWMIAGLALMLTPVGFAQGDFVRIENGWAWFLLYFLLITGGIALGAYLYGRATRPGKAVQYAITAATHLFIWAVILLTFYPVIYLLAISFNENDSITATLPKEGNILFRSGVLPDPDKFSFIQYQKILEQTHILGYQWIFIVLCLAALIVIVVSLVKQRFGGSIHKQERYRNIAGAILFVSLATLVVSINPSQFYFINEDGQRIAASTNRKIILFIRNTLLVSGLTGIFAVLISTTAGYAFARMKFEGRYQTLLGFVFVQMFPGFMALVAIFYLLTRLDLDNSFIGLILAYSGGAIAFAAWIFKGYLDSISPSLEEAARVDGATRWGAFWRIILPVSIPMLLFIFLLQFIGTYSEFIMANILLTGEDKWTVGVGLRAFTSGQFNTQWGALAASAVLGSLPILIIFYSFQGSLTGQHTAGGVKG